MKFGSANITAQYKTDLNVTSSNQGSISVTRNDLLLAASQPAKIKRS